VGKTPLPAGAPLLYKALQGRLPYRLLHLFTVEVPCVPHPRTLRLAFVEVTRPTHSGLPEEAWQLVRVTQPTSGVAYDVVNAFQITGAGHIMPEEPDSVGVASQAWVANSHIDLATWNDIYWMDEDDIATVSAVYAFLGVVSAAWLCLRCLCLVCVLVIVFSGI
jgi:hypothetical protein